MDFKEYYKQNRTYLSYVDTRISRIVNIINRTNPSNLLDVGCGAGVTLKEIYKINKNIRLHAVDVYENETLKEINCDYRVSDITKTLPFEDSEFDCVLLGEVIEHIPNPDDLLREIRRVLKEGGTLIISTPNLVSWANRILVPLGIQPLFTETSSEVNLGRYFKVLGQGNKTQGHLKVFTHASLKEILELYGFKITQRIGNPFFFPFPISIIDRFFCNFISLSSDLLYVAKRD